jgi:hypothetical protein
VKARVVKLNPQRGAARGRQFVGAKAVDAHLRYLDRDGVTKDGGKGQVYSAGRDVEDGRAFLDRGREDRHQFRFIVSAEDREDLVDPRETTRDLMKPMEADHQTGLDRGRSSQHRPSPHPYYSFGASPRTVRPSTLPAIISPMESANGPARRLPGNWAARPSLR